MPWLILVKPQLMDLVVFFIFLVAILPISYGLLDSLKHHNRVSKVLGWGTNQMVKIRVFEIIKE
jgi:hypothetical protein